MQIYPAAVDDAHRIAEIHVATWQVAYAGILPDDYLAGLSVEKRAAYWREEIPLGKQNVAVARRGDTICGWVSYGPSRDKDAVPGAAEIWAIYVAPEYWSGGAGRQLWLHAQAHLAEQGFQSVSLWVLAANSRAIDFYAKAGFAPDPASAREFVLSGATLSEIRYTTCLPKSNPA